MSIDIKCYHDSDDYFTISKYGTMFIFYSYISGEWEGSVHVLNEDMEQFLLDVFDMFDEEDQREIMHRLINRVDNLESIKRHIEEKINLKNKIKIGDKVRYIRFGELSKIYQVKNIYTIDDVEYCKLYYIRGESIYI